MVDSVKVLIENIINKHLSINKLSKYDYIFYHPDCTVGFGISPNQLALADFNRRSGISPFPEDN